MAITSILHRVSGLAVFLLLPVLLFILSKSLHSEEFFAQTKMMIAHPGYKFVLWAFTAAMIYHVLAGIRHILMDIGFGEHLEAGRRSSILVMVLAIMGTIFLGIWIW